MKITLIHGENQVEARNRYLKIIETIKSRGWDIVSLAGNLNLRDQLNSNSLFSDNILFVKDSGLDKVSSEDLKWLVNNFETLDTNLLLYHKGLLAKTVLNKLPKQLKIESYDLPKELFVFLETIYPGNAKVVAKFLHKLVKTEAVELVFTMLVRHMRDLYWVSIDEKTTGFPSWKSAKLKIQAKRFRTEKLEKLISELADIDLKTKTSQGELLPLLDFMFVKILE